MFVLAIDTSSAAVTAGIVAAGDDIEVVAERSAIAARGHGELLTPSIAACLADAGLRAADLGAVVVGTGPGPYTGLRVGMVTAAAFADALAAPVYGVCSLDAIAAACPDPGPLLVVTDARRREVYWARYADGLRTDGPKVDRPQDVGLAAVSQIAGAGVELYPDAWRGPAQRAPRYPTAAALVRLALDRIRAGAPSEPPVPLYLRRPDAVVPGAPKAVTQ